MVSKTFFDNPEATAKAYGVAGTTVGIGAAALAGQWLSEQGKPKKPKSLIGRYMIDAVDGSEHSGDDVFDLVYVLIKLAKG